MKNLFYALASLLLASSPAFADSSLPPLDASVSTQAASSPAAVAQSRWNRYIAHHAPVCAPEFDSFASINPDSDKVALLLHGVGSDPHAMVELEQFFISNGYSVLAPRLTGHYDRNMKNLDHATAAQWIADSEEAFAIARTLGPKVTLVGYSLGAVLASRLDLKYDSHIDKMVLFAPAWRINTLIGIGSLLGALSNMSLNDLQGIPPACKDSDGYIPSSSGVQVQGVIDRVEAQFGYPGIPGATAFTRMQAPDLIFTSANDQAIDIEDVTNICKASGSACKEIRIPDTTHLGIEEHLGKHSMPTYHGGEQVGSILTRFIQARD